MFADCSNAQKFRKSFSNVRSEFRSLLTAKPLFQQGLYDRRIWPEHPYIAYQGTVFTPSESQLSYFPGLHS